MRSRPPSRSPRKPHPPRASAPASGDGERRREEIARAKAPRKSTQPPLRAGRNVYIVQTQPGFETIAWREITASIDDADRIGFRTVPARSGMVVFSTARPERLATLRTAEDVFALISYRRGLGTSRGTLQKIESAVRTARYLEDALGVKSRLTPGSRAGRRLRFKVVARMVGEHEFRRTELRNTTQAGILSRGDHTWRLDEASAEVEFWVTTIEDEWLLAVRLTDDRMRLRGYKTAHLPGSLRPSVGAALALLSNPRDDDVVLDPMCGTGTVLIERAHLGRYAKLLGGDSDAAALEAARENVGPRYKPIELKLWDAVALPLPDSSATKIVTNLPWGMKHGSHAENRRLYPRMLAEFVRVLAKGGLMVLITAETRLMRELWREGMIKPSQVMRVSVLGASAAIYVCPRDAIVNQ